MKKNDWKLIFLTTVLGVVVLGILLLNKNINSSSTQPRASRASEGAMFVCEYLKMFKDHPGNTRAKPLKYFGDEKVSGVKVRPGSSYIYFAQSRNISSEIFVNSVFTVTLPSFLQLVNVEPSGCPYNSDTGVLTCNYPYIGPGYGAAIVFRVKILENAPIGNFNLSVSFQSLDPLSDPSTCSHSVNISNTR